MWMKIMCRRVDSSWTWSDFWWCCLSTFISWHVLPCSSAGPGFLQTWRQDWVEISSKSALFCNFWIIQVSRYPFLILGLCRSKSHLSHFDGLTLMIPIRQIQQIFCSFTCTARFGCGRTCLDGVETGVRIRPWHPAGLTSTNLLASFFTCISLEKSSAFSTTLTSLVDLFLCCLEWLNLPVNIHPGKATFTTRTLLPFNLVVSHHPMSRKDLIWFCGPQ